MKKIILLAAGALLIGATAQAQISIAPEAGVNLANIHQRYKDGTDTKNTNGGIKVGVKAGANVDIWIGDRLSIQPGLFYSIKGSKFTDDNVLNKITIAGTNNITLHYAELPVNVQYYFNDPSEGRLFVGVGAYVAMAFSGKNKYHGNLSSDTTIDYKFGDDAIDNNIRRFDFGAQGNVGYLLRSGIFFRGMYQLGISNLVPAGNRAAGGFSEDDKATNSNITISVGYMLHGAPKGKGPKMKGSQAM